MVDDGEGEAALWWCSRCYRVTGVASFSSAPLFEGYHSCPGCPGVCLLLPARFGEYARSSLVLLASHGPASPVPLAELGRIVGFARSQHASRSPSSRAAAVVAAEPGLRDLLVSAEESGDLEDALLTLWIIVNELLIATHDPSVVAPGATPDRYDHLASLFRVIVGSE